MRATSSWSRDSERVVNPTRSANRTETVRALFPAPRADQHGKGVGPDLGEVGCGPWATRRVDQARYTLCTLRQSRYRSFTVATAGPSSEAAYVNRQSERAKPFKTTATAHSQAGEAQRSPPPDLGPPPGYARARPPGCLLDQVGRAA